MPIERGATKSRKWLVALIIYCLVVGGMLLYSPNAIADLRYLPKKTTFANTDRIIVQGAFDITGPPHSCYEVYFAVWRDASVPLMTKSQGQERSLRVHWGDIVTPQNVATARYADCRAAFRIADIAASSDLPAGARTVLWVTCEVSEADKGGILGASWEACVPLIVPADTGRRIVGIAVFNTEALDPARKDEARPRELGCGE